MSRALIAAGAVTAVLLAATALPVMAQRSQQPAGLPNPFQGDAIAAAAGQKVYETNCLSCHGVNGGAGEIGPALVNTTRSDTPLAPHQTFLIIKNGVSGTPMPGWSPQLPDDDIWRIVTYVQSLRGTAVDSPTDGDVAAGSAIFFGKGQCSSCHMIGGKGGVTAPELSNLAASRKVKQITDALTKEHHTIYPPGGAHLSETVPAGGWAPVTVVTPDGRTVTGVLVSQDNYSLQVMGDDQKLHLYDRAKLRSVKIEAKSRMPTDYDKRLAANEFRDLLAYLTRQASMPRPGRRP